MYKIALQQNYRIRFIPLKEQPVEPHKIYIYIYITTKKRAETGNLLPKKTGLSNPKAT